MGFFVTGNRGTIRGPLRCNPTDACLKLYQAMKGVGTDEAVLVQVISSHTNRQRQQIKKKYQQVYKKDLMSELDSEISAEFGKLIAALMTEPEDFILESIHKAVMPQSRGGKIVKRLSALFSNGLGKTEYSLLSLFFPRTNKELQEIKDAFNFKYQLDIEERIAHGGDDLPQDFCTLILDILGGERDESEEVDEEQLEDDLDSVLEGGSSSEEAFHEIIMARSFNHLRQFFERYLEEAGKTMEDFVEQSKSFSAELKETYKGMIMLVVNEPVFYADRLRQAILGAGTDDQSLIRIVVLRSEIDLMDIMEVYENKFGVSLADDVAGDTSGDYKDILLKIISSPTAPLKEERKTGTRTRNRPVRKSAQKQEETEVEEEEKVPEKKVAARNAARRKQVAVKKQEEEEKEEAVEEKEEEVVEEEVVKPRKVKPRAAANKTVGTKENKPRKVAKPVEPVDEEEKEEKKVQRRRKVIKAKTVAVGKFATKTGGTEEEEGEEDQVEDDVVACKTLEVENEALPVTDATEEEEDAQAGLSDEGEQTEVEEIEHEGVETEEKSVPELTVADTDKEQENVENGKNDEEEVDGAGKAEECANKPATELSPVISREL